MQTLTRTSSRTPSPTPEERYAPSPLPPAEAPQTVTVAQHELTVYVESPPLFAEMVNDILAAKRRVWVETYIFYNDEGGKRFADLYPETPDPDDLPSCEAVGVLGPVTGVIGTLMAMEAIKLITDSGAPLAGRLLLYDGRAARFTELQY